jgi:hypothetical protein
MFSHKCIFQTSKFSSLWYVSAHTLTINPIFILGAGIIYFLLYLPYTVLINYGSQTLRWHKVIAVRI